MEPGAWRPGKRGRSWFALAVVLVFVASLVGACAGPAKEAKPEKTMVIAMDVGDASSMDPAVAFETASIFTAHQCYDNLVTFEGGDLSKPGPELAESWEVSQDGLVWTFKLKKGLKFPSGEPVTAAAVAYSFDRVIALDDQPAWLLTQTGMEVGSTKALDESTVQITLKEKFNPDAFLAVLTYPVASVVDPKVCKEHEKDGDWGKNFLAGASAGNGPYILEKWEPEVQVVLKANPNYWKGKVPMSTVIVKHVPESTAQKMLLEKGDAQIAMDLRPEQIKDLEGKSGFQIIRGLGDGINYLGMNVAYQPFKDNRVRDAVRWAIDYDGLVKHVLQENAIVLQTFIPKGYKGYNPDTPYQQDVEKARQLLKEAGYPNGLKAELLCSSGVAGGGVYWRDIAAKLKDDLAKVGITVEIKEMTSAALLDIYRAQKHQMVLMGWGPDYPDPDALAKPFANHRMKQLTWRNSYYNDDLADKVDKAAAAFASDERLQLYRELTDYVLHNGPFAILYQPRVSIAMRDSVLNYQYNSLWTTELASIDLK
ncbi:MAG: ABC transporter substrate-binding protein [Bacillota bacterium]